MTSSEANMTKIRVADHAPFPGVRFTSEGPSSGEAFRKDILVPALRSAIESHGIVTVDLDGVPGYGSSFLEEAFGGLVRSEGFSHVELKSHLKVIATGRLYKPYAELVARYISKARRSPVAA